MDSTRIRSIRWPSKVTVPVHGTRREMAARVEVLPAPLGPSRATASPSATSSDTPDTASTAP